MKNKLVVLLCILLFGGIGVYLTFFSGDTSKYDSEVDAYSIDANEEYDSDGTIYHPIYRFKVDGKEYECKSNSGSSSYPKQSKKKVYYDSKNPEKCLTEYEKSSSKFGGIICIVVAVLMVALLFMKPSTNTNVTSNEIDPETERKINEQMEKVGDVINKVSLIVKRVILGIIIFVLFLIILFDVGMVKQTIKAKDYIDTTATYVDVSDGHGEVFVDYVYSFEDKDGKSHNIVVSFSKDETPDQKLKIKYNPSNPEDFYQESNVYDKSGIIWFVVKIVIEVLLVILFFNKKLLSKINLSVRSN